MSPKNIRFQKIVLFWFLHPALPPDLMSSSLARGTPLLQVSGKSCWQMDRQEKNSTKNFLDGGVFFFVCLFDDFLEPPQEPLRIPGPKSSRFQLRTLLVSRKTRRVPMFKEDRECSLFFFSLFFFLHTLSVMLEATPPNKKKEGKFLFRKEKKSKLLHYYSSYNVITNYMIGKTVVTVFYTRVSSGQAIWLAKRL